MDINYSPLRQLIREQIKEKYDREQNWGPLWHYTNVSGFRGIINRDGKLVFWFTRCDLLNDTSEGKYIEGLFQMIIEKMLKEEQISQEFYNVIKDCKADTKRYISYAIPPREGYAGESVLENTECEAFICCFSLASDSLDMWRYYSKNDGGYSLKIAPMVFDSHKRVLPFRANEDKYFNNLYGYSVEYDIDKQSANITDIVRRCYEAYSKGVPDRKNDDKNARAIICDFLQEYQFVYKHPCFSSENEYRFVYFRPKKRPAKMTQKMYDIKYRDRNGILVPYIEIEVENAQQYLEEVMLSPMISERVAKDTAEEFLVECGFNGKVSLSKLPVRE